MPVKVSVPVRKGEGRQLGGGAGGREEADASRVGAPGHSGARAGHQERSHRLGVVGYDVKGL